jgi:lipid II:glycine glycyltransferase (peptidoglycan interpeptide bridge formation enzyme)
MTDGSRAEVDRIDRAGWSASLRRFEDATIYQTWPYGAVRWGEKHLSHFLLRDGDEVCGAAQVAIRKAPLVRVGIAYVPWGPVWRRRGRGNGLEEFRRTVRELRREYVSRRRLLLRVAPNEIETGETGIRRVLEEEGFVFGTRPYRTLLVDLSRPMEELRDGASRRWRRALKTAAAKGLRIEEGTGDDLFEILSGLHREMAARKRFRPGIDVEEFRAVQRELPDAEKMKVMVCRSGGKPVAALCASLLGEKAIGLAGGTGPEGLDSGSFHLLNWRMMESMKEAGARCYDFGGYDPEKTPGTASFKEGMPGRDVLHVGHYEAFPGPLARALVKSADSVRLFLRDAGRSA